MTISIQSHEESGAVVLDTSLINQLTRGSIIDAPITLLREDPPIWILPTAMQQNGEIFLSHTLLKGHFGDLSNAEYKPVNEHDLFITPKHLQDKNTGRHWITNLHHTSDGILAFLHSEYTGENDFFGMPAVSVDGVSIKAPGKSTIGLAWLPKKRLDADNFQFDYLGHIVSYCSDVPHFNVSGTPFFENTENGTAYLNILFKNVSLKRTEEGWGDERLFVSQARAPLKDVIENAKKGELTAWKKKSSDGWIDAMGTGKNGKVATSVLPEVKGHPDSRIAIGDVIVHSDARYFPEIERYILVGYTLHQKRRNPSSLVVYSSKDGLKWEFETSSNERTDGIQGWSYVKILREGRSDKSNSPYLLVGWDYGKAGRSIYRLDLQIQGV